MLPLRDARLPLTPKRHSPSLSRRFRQRSNDQRDDRRSSFRSGTTIFDVPPGNSRKPNHRLRSLKHHHRRDTHEQAQLPELRHRQHDRPTLEPRVRGLLQPNRASARCLIKPLLLPRRSHHAPNNLRIGQHAVGAEALA